MSGISDKENMKEPSVATPQGSPNGKMWDSNDPMRNPPPLPVSPQMLKIKNTNVSRSTSPGKLAFTQVDNGEVEYQLKRLVESQSSLKKTILNIENSVKTTQIDLENLVSRSTNNNSHLKDLLQNVSGSNVNSLTEDKIEKVFQDSISPILKDLSNLNESHKELTNKSNGSKHIEKIIESKSHELNANISKLLSSNQLDSIHEKLDSNKDSFENIKDSSNKSLELINSFDKKFNDLNISLDKSNEFENDIQSKLSKIENVIELIDSRVNESLNKEDNNREYDNKEIINDDYLKESSKNIIESISQNFHDKINDNNNKVASFQQNLNEQFIKHDSRIESILNNINEKFDNTDNKIELISNLINEKFINNENKIDSLKIELISITETEQIKSKNLELELKDKEIEELKRKLEEQSSKQEINESINELITKKVQLETRFELLNEAYDKRYKEFQQLYNDHNELITQMSNINIDKLATIVGSATLSKYSSNDINSSPKKQNSKRVLSTNSYLTNVNIGTPKTVKKYEMDLVETSEEF